ncbi:hypothetical protein ACFL59_06970 [Planctomycetota bacterium]
MRQLDRDSAVPPPNQLFQPVWDRRGLRLAIVLGNHAPRGQCPHAAADLCHHCDIGLGEGAQFDTPTNLRRLQLLNEHYRDVLPEVRHLVLYNSGSCLSPRELSIEVLESALNLARALPQLRMVSVDSREAYVRAETLRRLLFLLGRGRELRVILGIESASDEIRCGLLDKRMPKSAIERAVAVIGVVGAELLAETDRGVEPDSAMPGLAVNVVVGVPGTDGASAVRDAVATSAYGLELAERYGMALDVNVHPYYPTRRGLKRFPDHPRCSDETIRKAVAAISAQVGDRGVVFVGWQDELHDLEQELRVAQLSRLGPALDRVNRTGQTDLL